MVDGVIDKVDLGDGVIYHTTLSKMDKFWQEPENLNGDFYFNININGENVKFYQSGEYTSVFPKVFNSESYVFTPNNKKYKNYELHIINDYDQNN